MSSHSVDRRTFLSLTAAAAGSVVVPERLAAAPRAPVGRSATPGLQEAPAPPLGNGEHPAFAFQAYPGGTGALYARWHREGVDPFARHPIPIAPWTGPLPRDEREIAYLPVHRLAALIRDGHLTSEELTRIYLDRLKRYDPVLLCAVTILEERALEEARRADAELRSRTWRGPLHGIPYGVKDLFAVSGAPTTWGSADFAAQRLDEDADVVIRLREAGAVLLAKLATGEFARGDRWFRGQTRNPWNPEEGSSGSSAGPGSATAAGCVAFAIGTETQGSIVSPSRRCGLSALRPTFGRVSRAGGMVLSWTMDKVGPMCRSALDCALVFDAIRGASERDPSSLTAPFRFDPGLSLVGRAVGFTDDAPEAFLEQLEDLGAELRSMPPLPRGRSNALSVESAAAFDFHIAPGGVEPEPLPQDLSPAERRRLGRFRQGREVRAIDYVNSQRRRRLLMLEMAEVMEGVELFVSGSGQIGLTNQTGHPCVVLPYGFGVRNPDADSPTTMPLTTTLIGNLFTDDLLLAVSHAFQRVTDWHRRTPPAF